MNETVLEFHLKYNIGRKNGQDVFIAMGEYISAYEKFGGILTDAIGSNVSFECTLQEVRAGSIIGKLAFVFDKLTCPDGLISSLTEEIGTVDQLEEITDKYEEELHKRMLETEEYCQKLPPNISKIDTAYAMKELSSANSRLEPGESMSVSDTKSTQSNVLKFDTKFRFTGDISTMFANYVDDFHGEELLEVIKPCYQGNLTWRVRSLRTNFEYDARIKCTKWLEKFQAGEEDFTPRDNLRVNVSYDIYINKGVTKIKNARITEVCEVVKNAGRQNELF